MEEGDVIDLVCSRLQESSRVLSWGVKHCPVLVYLVFVLFGCLLGAGCFLKRK